MTAPETRMVMGLVLLEGVGAGVVAGALSGVAFMAAVAS